MCHKVKNGIAVLAFAVLAGLPLACRPPQADPTPLTTEGSTQAPGQTPGQKVLDRFLGTWDWEATIRTPGANPEESRETGRTSITRVLGGRYIQEMTGAGFLGLYTYDPKQECYWNWGFASSASVPEPVVPCKGAWNEAARTLDWTRPDTDGYALTIQNRFTSDDARECVVAVKNPGGKEVYRAEYRLTRARGPQS